MSMRRGTPERADQAAASLMGTREQRIVSMIARTKLGTWLASCLALAAPALAQPTLTLHPVDSCLNSTEPTTTIEIRMTGAGGGPNIVGGQFYLAFDPTKWSISPAFGADIATGDAPFTLPISADAADGPGTLRISVGVSFTDPGTTVDTIMARVTFHKLAESCSTPITFRAHTPPTQLTVSGGGAVPVTTVDTAVTIDNTAPTLVCPATITVYADAGRCDALVSVGTTATDLCTALPTILGVRSDAQPLGAPYPAGTTTITWTATDGCGNTSPPCAQSIVVQPFNQVATAVQLEPNVAAGPFSRCIDLDFRTCPCPDYSMTVGTGAIVPATTDLGDYDDDTLTTVALPFPFTFYCNQYTSVLVGTNGEVLFSGSDIYGPYPGWVADSTHCPLPTPSPQGASLAGVFPFWADLLTSGGNGEGIFTSVSGTAPHRIFNIEWRAERFVNFVPTSPYPPIPTGAADINFEVRLYEGQRRIDFVYGTIAGNGDGGFNTLTTAQGGSGGPAVIVGVQASSSGPATQYQCSTTSGTGQLGTPGLMLTFDSNGAAPASVAQTMSFGSGNAAGTVLVPCGVYTCATARDPLHTLRRTDEAFHVNGANYVADFTGDPASGGDWLIGGNLNDDQYIDILDFGTFIGQYGLTVGASTTCSTSAPHSDIDGDASVGNGDFSSILINFFKTNEANCCGGPLTPDAPRRSITLAELHALGLDNLAVADLNRDGVIDQRDMGLFGTHGACPADWNGDGQLNVRDFLAFLTSFSAADADWNGDGSTNIVDFLGFLSGYSAGCR
jgi:hypothetical protein